MTWSRPGGGPSSASTADPAGRRAGAGAPAGVGYVGPVESLVEITIPVLNEESALEASVDRLRDFLEGSFPHRFRLVIADNGSEDETPRIGRRLRDADPTRVDYVRFERSGRGRALRGVWAESDADVLCYMDVDLSTGLEALRPLVDPLVAGEADLAIGTRLAVGSRVVRGPGRELISRAYNGLLHRALGTGVSDAQCGFKAGRAGVIQALLPAVADEGWFFDTELLFLAERRGLRIAEVPVEWVEDPDSRVSILRTSVADLLGIARLSGARRIRRRQLPL